MSRPETGAMRFDGDWRGIFIRGDNAFGFAINLRLAKEDRKYAEHVIDDLIKLFESADERVENVQTQHMKPFSDCEDRR